ncbi:MAG: NifU family protein [Saprospiraceae bacterium]|nr:NifU family protein [Candidatus Opimibacter skivensis]MBL0005765.1 NifU family protein [Candidatus Opimibacter skivensis]MBP6681035.1 NifU family protein [Saprospiraceae bacterium]HQW25032.1 NifU family protein [Saprospiraceae bacterium]
MSDQEKTLLLHQIELALDDIRPHLAVDGGDVSVVDVTDEMIVRVKWLGACESCSMSIMTMKAGVEQAVKSRLPQIRSVEAVNAVHV